MPLKIRTPLPWRATTSHRTPCTTSVHGVEQALCPSFSTLASLTRSLRTKTINLSVTLIFSWSTERCRQQSILITAEANSRSKGITQMQNGIEFVSKDDSVRLDWASMAAIFRPLGVTSPVLHERTGTLCTLEVFLLASAGTAWQLQSFWIELYNPSKLD